jgi:hypothetical protein
VATGVSGTRSRRAAGQRGVGSRNTERVLRRAPVEGHEDIGAANVVVEVHQVDREGARHPAFDHRPGAKTQAVRARTREDHAREVLGLQMAHDVEDLAWRSPLHVNRGDVAAAGEHDIFGSGALLEARVDQRLLEVDLEPVQAKAVIGNHDDVGLVFETELPQLVEDQPDISIVVADASDAFRRACAEAVVHSVRLSEPIEHRCRPQIGRDVVTQHVFGPVHRFESAAGSGLRWRRGEPRSDQRRPPSPERRRGRCRPRDSRSPARRLPGPRGGSRVTRCPTSPSSPRTQEALGVTRCC